MPPLSGAQSGRLQGFRVRRPCGPLTRRVSRWRSSGLSAAAHTHHVLICRGVGRRHCQGRRKWVLRPLSWVKPVWSFTKENV